MSTLEELEQLLAAERRQEPPTGAAEVGWTKLHAALASGAPGLGIATGALRFGVMSAGKWAAIGASTLALGGGAWFAQHQRHSAPAPHVRMVTPAARTTQAPLPTQAASAPPTLSAPSPQPAERAPSPLASSPPVPPTFDEELRLIRLAKSELDAGRPHLASVWLAEHKSRFPTGVFATERDALGLLMDCARDPVGSRAQAQAFVHLHHDAPIADRVIRVCRLGGTAGAASAGSGAATEKSINGSALEREPTGKR